MKTTTTLLKMTSVRLLGIVSLAFTSCGSYTGVSYYNNDGIYSTPRKTVYEIPVNESLAQQKVNAGKNNQNPNEFGSYFSERANTYADLLSEDVITHADQYVGSGNEASAMGQEYTTNQAQAGWGGNPSSITVEVHNNPWFDYFYPGNPAAMWGYQGLYFNQFRMPFNGRLGWSAGWGMDPWGFGFNQFGMNGWGWNNFGWNNWGWNNWGWGANRWNNWGWGGWAFNNPSLYYGPYNYNRVQRYARNSRLNARSRYRTSYAVNSTRRGKNNQETRRRSSTYALRRNTLNVNGLRTYLRNSDNSRVVDAYRNNNAAPQRRSGRTTQAVQGLRSTNIYNSVRNNANVRTPRATRSNGVVRSAQTVGTQMYRNLSPTNSNYRSSGTRAGGNTRSVSPIRRTPSTSNNSAIQPTQRNNRSSNYRSAPTRSSTNTRSSAPSRSVRSSSSTRSSSSSSSRRSSGRNNIR